MYIKNKCNFIIKWVFIQTAKSKLQWSRLIAKVVSAHLSHDKQELFDSYRQNINSALGGARIIVEPGRNLYTVNRGHREGGPTAC